MFWLQDPGFGVQGGCFIELQLWAFDGVGASWDSGSLYKLAAVSYKP